MFLLLTIVAVLVSAEDLSGKEYYFRPLLQPTLGLTMTPGNSFVTLSTVGNSLIKLVLEKRDKYYLKINETGLCVRDKTLGVCDGRVMGFRMIEQDKNRFRAAAKPNRRFFIIERKLSFAQMVSMMRLGKEVCLTALNGTLHFKTCKESQDQIFIVETAEVKPAKQEDSSDDTPMQTPAGLPNPATKGDPCVLNTIDAIAKKKNNCMENAIDSLISKSVDKILGSC